MYIQFISNFDAPNNLRHIKKYENLTRTALFRHAEKANLKFTLVSRLTFV